MPVRIYDLAKKLGLDSKSVLAKAKELGIATAKVPSSSLDKITAEYLEEQLRPLAKFVEPAAPAEVPAFPAHPVAESPPAVEVAPTPPQEVSAPAAPAIAAADIPVEVVAEARPEVPIAQPAEPVAKETVAPSAPIADSPG